MHPNLKRFALILVTAAVVLAQTGSDFSGTWKLLPDKSDFGKVKAPSGLTYEIKMNGTNMHFKFEREGVTGRSSGFEIDMKIGGPAASTSTGDAWAVKREGKTLVVNVDNSTNGSKQVQIWTLSPDGKQFTDTTTLTLPNVEGTQTIRRVFQKQ